MVTNKVNCLLSFIFPYAPVSACSKQSNFILHCLCTRDESSLALALELGFAIAATCLCRASASPYVGGPREGSDGHSILAPLFLTLSIHTTFHSGLGRKKSHLCEQSSWLFFERMRLISSNFMTQAKAKRKHWRDDGSSHHWLTLPGFLHWGEGGKG